MSIETAHATREMLSISDQLRQEQVINFIGQNEQFVLDVSRKMETALGRFDFLPKEKRDQTATELTYLWIQAKIAQEYAEQQKSNPISGFNVGVGMGVHLKDRFTGETYFWDAAGSNREPHPFPIAAAHGETSAIEVLRHKLAPLLAPEGQDFKIDLVALTASPCGSCRGEIYKNRSSDDALVAVVDDSGNVSINTIAELFPTEFTQIDVPEFQSLIRQVRENTRFATPSIFEQKPSTSAIALLMDDMQTYFIGHQTGDAAFLSKTATISAIDQLKQSARRIPLLQGADPDAYYQEAEKILFSHIIAAIYVFSGHPTPYLLSGIDRQQLSVLGEDTIVILVDTTSGKTYKTTRGQLLPAAFSKETPTV